MLQKINQLKNHQGFRKYFANTSWLMAERILRMFITLFVSVYVARYLGPERFGLLSYANSFVGLFLALATLGLNGIVVRELVKSPERRNELLGTAFGLKIIGAILMWLVILTAVHLTSNDVQTNTLIAIIAFAAIFQAFNVIDFNYQAEVKSKYVVHAQLIQLVVSSIAKLVLIFIEAPLIWFAWVYCLDTVVLAMGLAVMYLYHSGRIWVWRWKWKVAGKLLKDGWPLILSGMVISIYMKIDQVMIKEMLGAEQVGLYAAAVRLSEAWYFIPVAISTSLFPAIISAKKQSEELYYQRLQKLYDLMVWVAIAIALPTTFLAPWIIEKLLYGEAYIGAANVLSIHIWTGVFVGLASSSGRWLLAENYQIYSFYRYLVGAIINVVLNYFLIKKLGIIGSAWATLVSYMVASYLMDYFFCRMKKNFYMKTSSILFNYNEKIRYKASSR
ncbi:flippase [Achromatium sp. WMS3]|nr:flippase [Achromatium sp. WMS3]